MTKQESARFEALEAQIKELSSKIEALSAKPAPAPRKVWVNPHRNEVPSIAEIVEWRRSWAKANPGFTQSAIEAAELEFKATWFAARHAA